jgi:signal transduction histidine kinase
MSETAHSPGEGKRGEVPAAAATPDVVEPERAQNQAPPAPDLAEALKRRLVRLALDVHDGPMQNLAVIGFSLGDLRRRLQLTLEDGDHAQIDAGMEQLGADLGRVESDLRALITALEDGGVTSLPLVDAIDHEIVEFERRSAAKVEFHAIGEVRVETDSQRIALQSVTREALANVAKHAAAHNVWITLSGTEDAVSLEIEDDGRGFRVGAKSKKGRIGLDGMRNRIEMLGGEFRVKSRRGGPTNLTATPQAWHPTDPA